jgi:SAM-dependent methyltransferase
MEIDSIYRHAVRSGKDILRPVYRKARNVVFGEQVWLDRLVLYRETSRIISTLPIGNMDALEISGNRWAEGGFRSFLSVHYPDYDICAEPLARLFDIIFAEQIFEHLLWPHRAARHVHAMLRPGGYLFVTVPFLQKVHNFPIDCSRWTETGIKYLLADSGFHLDDIQTWSWGNRAAAKANLNRRRFPLYNPILHRNLKNDPLFPVQVWALARRSTE